MKPWKHATVLAMAATLAGCSIANWFNSSKEQPPAPLQKFKEEVRLHEEWSRSIGEGQGKTYNLLVPAVEGDTLFVADVGGQVMALDRFSGKVIWRKNLDVPVSGGVGAGYGQVLLGTLQGEVIALDSGSGEVLWRSRVSSEVLAPPVSNGDVVVVQTQEDRLIALEASSGSQRWTYESTPAVLTLRGTGAPLVTNQLAIAGLSSGKVLALETQRGLPIWEQRVAVPSGRSELERVVDIDGGLEMSGGTLYVATFQGSIAALDLQTGRPRWQRQASSNGSVALGYGSVYVSLAEGAVEGIDEGSASALWKNDGLARRQLSSPAVFSSYVAVGDLEGYLHLLSQVDGRFVGRIRIDSEGLRARPLVVGDWLYAYGNGGNLVALTIR
ncbi:YfgL-like phosphoquinolipoprotein kinase [Azotobacter vinelandii CA]|uniref:Outer membrane protein assembly factor BamB n=2 Tax=Azotobacter vinelandii TaxID=354 RepID=C1DE54_AZOVD|nr:outer membrane protein assembly factor BamB [Azotobacter vinelandii]ACO80162.1 YfgL-like phosphoquinolipoprotein kinase [Azotobacter vinelandii DJ]AGK16084.1 YfgL-like phosphoquinolipoprotein kinase [Azotobacter vinelandii CA]AGK21745.1 YfgL-like phosphoquinolipoprotein kinase [Azotobacter vinelandii CA6]SFX20988.1 Beta-barrel assembly machine subunit BamB [Azotobacter vinelandii]GLK62041.1 outer membrane protein assembly factor BamB [Azotobacter vinelandii]